MRAFPLLSVLADGEARSLEELAAAMDSDAREVEALLEEIDAAGIATRRDGGQVVLPGGLELLQPQRVQSGLSVAARALLAELDLHAQIDSTNTEAMRRLERGPSGGLVITAEQQTAGRGRRGRDWASPFGSNLYLTTVWQFDGGHEVMEGLSLAVGVAVAEALAEVGLENVELKWPNDIQLNGDKLGGILIEAVGSASGAANAVVGIGLNMKMPAMAAEAIDQPWTDLSRHLGAISRNATLASLLNHLLPLLAEFENRGLGHWRERWQARDALRGREVTVQQGDGQVAGRARGIGERGELLLDIAGTEQRFSGGEVSIRLSE